MKKLFKSAAIVAASLLLAVNFSSCNKDPQPTTEETNKAQKEAIVKQYLNHTVYPTYAQLAETSLAPPPTSASTRTSTRGLWTKTLSTT